MTTVIELDEQINLVSEWILRAGKALMGFYNEELGVFWRDSFAKSERDRDAHPTSTTRCFYALREYLRFLDEEDLKEEGDWNKGEVMLRGVVEKYLSQLPFDPDYVQKPRHNQINMFTNSHILMAVALLDSLDRKLNFGDVDLNAIKAAAHEIAKDTKDKLLQFKGGKVHPTDEIYDFVTIYAVRGLDAYDRGWAKENPETEESEAKQVQLLRDRVLEDVLRLIAFYSANVSSKFDPAELAFSIGILNRFPHPYAQQFTTHAVEIIKKAQTREGGWTTARIISYEGSGFFQVASYEVALTLADVLIRKIYTNDMSVCQMIRSALDDALSLIISHYNRVNGDTGWANDHARRSGLIQSWATAIVVIFLIHYHDALMLLQQRLILAQYSAIQPQRRQRLLAWPDMMPAFRNPDWMDFDRLELIRDPSYRFRISTRIKNEIILPIAENWIHRPEKTSILLYGPPGTGKTTLVKTIAQVLRWPFIVISPPSFLRNGGLEGFEASAAELFDNMLRLRRVVILFDECEDFFKKRERSQQLANRTIGAFITAGMLPRLQALKEKKWVIFVLSTNSKLNELDNAAIRPGRFDITEEVTHPVLPVQRQYVQSRMEGKDPQIVAAMLEALDIHNRAQRRPAKALPFNLLDVMIQEACEKSLSTEQEVYKMMGRLLSDEGWKSMMGW